MKHLTIFYDGPCILCNYWIQNLCRWDKKDQLRFTSLDSEYAIQFFKENPSPILSKDAIITWDQNQGYHAEAHAIFSILKRLNGLWRLFLIFQFLPVSWTNGLYRYIAHNRYRWFGKHQQCPLPKKRDAHKFL